MKEIIVIIGGGIAGMEAASQLLKLGYSPIIIEKGDRLGGHVARWNRLFPDMTPAQDLVSGLIAGCKDANIFLNTEISFINRLKESYNIMLSNGISINTKHILITTGFRLFEAEKKEEYGYGVYDQVITNADLENWFNTGDDDRINNSRMESIGFVHCVGSRDEKARNTQCSKVCCITAIKQAIELKEKYPHASIYCFYMDLRLFGKKFEDFYTKAQRDYGIHFIRGRVSEVSEDIEGKVIVKAEDTLLGKPIKVTLDLLVLMSGMVCNPDSTKTAGMLALPIDSDGFLQSSDNVFHITSSPKKGIFYAGACTGPKTVPETLAEARSAVLEIHSQITGSER
ncbi:MAG: CoB--CoM heterodisulfide reductase iron-sulfur subunit A family protein [Bacteroidales bacterium]|nr:CoB--CoM heterodisulfide reductase iron-sulfur subunit A family protein [Bacteroidales bacterium]MBQ9723005.1 CoB--CoM heterodisulfide reductase iron-sulfur subunit A family protein [Bacteroidales bacterium]